MRHATLVLACMISLAPVGAQTTLPKLRPPAVPLIAQRRTWRPMTSPTHLWIRRSQIDLIVTRAPPFSSSCGRNRTATKCPMRQSAPRPR